MAVKRLLRQFYDLAKKEIEVLILSDEHPNVVSKQGGGREVERWGDARMHGALHGRASAWHALLRAPMRARGREWPCHRACTAICHHPLPPHSTIAGVAWLCVAAGCLALACA